MAKKPISKINSLDPETRANALVGHYLSAWSVMESGVNNCISKALELDEFQSFVVTKNIPFGAKIKMLRTSVNMLFPNSKQGSAYDKALKKMGDMAVDRNMVAHEVFLPDESGLGIEFLVVRASGKLKFLNTVWSVKDVNQRVTALIEARDTLREIEKNIGNKQTLVKALKAAPAKNSLWQSLALQDLAWPQSPLLPDLDPPETKDAKPPQNPPPSEK